MAAPGTSAPSTASHSGDVDPISKFKGLIPRLRDSLANVMKVSAQVFYQNLQIDVLKSSDTPSQRIDKSLEEFYGICDQIELNLRLALDCHHQSIDNMKNIPVPVQGHNSKQEQQTQETQSYAQYLNTVKLQITSAKDLHDTLLECSKKISERQSQPTPHQLQQPHSGSSHLQNQVQA